MNDYIAVADIQNVLTARLVPSITTWNRLEGRPRAKNFDRTLRAEIWDPLWMLTKQWQMGEFIGDDAGSPVMAKIHLSTSRITKYQAGNNQAQLFEQSVPLETKVEQRPIPLTLQNSKAFLDLRLMMGRRWLKLIRAFPDEIQQQYRGRYAFELPDPDDEEQAFIVAHLEVWQQFATIAGRAMDGGALYEYLKASETHTAHDDITDLIDPQPDDLEQLGNTFVQWFEELFYQPPEPENNAWLPDHLEYQFRLSAPVKGTEKVMEAEEYYHGHLDWYNLSVNQQQADLGEVTGAGEGDLEDTITSSFLPSPLIFEGMPNTRWWEFEDRKTNFGNINPDTTDLNKLLLIEFGLVYANDWFMVPFSLPVGSIAQVEGLSVTNVFGERTWVEATGSGSDEDWQRWNMYSLNIKRDSEVEADTSLLLLPSVPKIQESRPLEEILFIRDEVANMVWGIERRVPVASGRSKRGREAARKLAGFYRRILKEASDVDDTADDPILNQAKIRYKIMTSVPENWIPFIPVHMDNDNREVQLQRAAMPRIIEGDPEPPEKIRPRTILLREGLDEDPAVAYFLHEEEVLRSGTRIKQTFQRTRWNDGKVFNWLGVRKATGKGENSSDLAFDTIPFIRRRRRS